MGSADLVPTVRGELQSFEDFVGYAAFMQWAKAAGIS
jgi:hypothetical protein